jgi:hypothetical protein
MTDIAELRPGIERQRSLTAASIEAERRGASPCHHQPEQPLPQLQKSAADAL